MIDDDKPSIEEAMVHFGVKGMRWGVINKDDRASRKQGRRDIKAEKFEARASVSNLQMRKLQKELNALPPGFRNFYKRGLLKSDLQDTTKHRDRLLKDSVAARNGKLTSTQKKVIVGGIAVAAIAGYITYSTMDQSGQANSLKLRGEAFMKGKEFEFAKNPKLASKNFSPDDVLQQVSKGVNPKYADAGGKMNCRRSTLTHELRRRGFDVRATTSSAGWGQSESGLINAVTPGEKNKYHSTSLSSMISGGKGPRAQGAGDTRLNPAKTITSIRQYTPRPYDSRTVSKIYNAPGINQQGSKVPIAPKMSTQHVMSTLFKQPDGSRGEILFNFKEFGHSMAYEIFDGKPMIFDSQKGTMYDASKGLGKLTGKWGIPIGAELTRLDNLPLDMTFLSRWATNV